MNRRIVQIALGIALKYRGEKHPNFGHKSQHYSFVIQDNAILEWGFNRPIQNPVHYGYERFNGRHAEIDAWLRARGILNGHPWDVLSLRLRKSGLGELELGDSAPCFRCGDILRSLGCRNIYYSTDMGRIVRVE